MLHNAHFAAQDAGVTKMANPRNVTLKEYAETWRANQAHRPTTQDQVERQFKLHVYPHLGDRPLATILPSDLRS